VQDAFINLWKRRHTVQLRNSFHTYIASVVKYEVMSKLAQRRKQPVYLDDIAIAPTQDHSTQQWLDFDELHIQMEQTIHTLPDKCQLVFRLSREEGFTARQISETLQISPKTVEAHISKALKILRVSLSSFFM
jgi:RNA polymerase sigma factor (sigma-70 family)